MSIELVCCEFVLLNEVSMEEITEDDISQTYAMAICSSEAKSLDWQKVNDAIQKRWTKKGLDRVRKKAWAIIKKHSATGGKS